MDNVDGQKDGGDERITWWWRAKRALESMRMFGFCVGKVFRALSSPFTGNMDSTKSIKPLWPNFGQKRNTQSEFPWFWDCNQV